MRIKSQSATEFLIIGTIALIIIIIAISLFEPTKTIGEEQKQLASQTYWSNADIAIKGIIYNNTHSQIFIQNNLNEEINITNIKLDNYNYTKNINLKVGQKNSTHIESNKQIIDSVIITYINLKNSQEYKFEGQQLFIQ